MGNRFLNMPPAPILYLIFFLSGVSALVFESLWFFQAGLALGNSIWASSLVLASFMAGLAIGNAWIGLRGDGILRPIRLYAGLELLIALSGTGIVLLLPGLAPLVAGWLGPLVDEPLWLNAFRTALGFFLMLLPATAMGATLPLLVSALYRQRAHFGEALGNLYGWNTLGAVSGVLMSEIFLVEMWGIRGAAIFASGCNCVAALLSFAVDRSLRGGTVGHVAETGKIKTPLGGRASLILATAFSLGALLLALEVVWFRFLILFVAGTSYSFAVMLAVVLAGIGSGGLLGSLCLRIKGEGGNLVSGLHFLAGSLCLWLYLGFDFYAGDFVEDTAADLGKILGLAVPLMFPVALISGTLFTLLGDELHRTLGGETRSAGLLTLANTLGAALGSLISGFVLLPALGIESTLFILALGYGLAGLLSLFARIRPATRVPRALATGMAVMLAASALIFPHGTLEENFLMRALAPHVPPEKVVAVRESLTETIVYTRREIFGEPRYYRLITNSHSMSATSLSAQRYMKIFVYLPVALHDSPRKALLISYGVGATARGLVDTAELETIDIVDISSDILEMSRALVSEGRESLEEVVDDSPLDDPRVSIHIEDGRFFLQTTAQRFDIITGEPPPPKLAGIVNLYTREYFQLIHDRLAAGGLTTYWLPVHSLLEEDAKAILRGFCDVFSDCTLWGGAGLDWIMLGSRGYTGPPREERFIRQWNDPEVGPEMLALGLEKPEQMGALFMADARQMADLLRETPPLVDDFPKRLSVKVEVGEFGSWMDVETTRRRFEESRSLQNILPPSLREGSLKYFEAQSYINRQFGVASESQSPEGGRRLPVVHRFMEEEGLRTLPLWMLEGNYDVVRAARHAKGRQKRNPLVHYEKGIFSLTAKNWREAEEHFARAAKLGRASGYLALRAYVLCRGGNFEAGRRFAAELLELGALEPDDALGVLLGDVCNTVGR